MLGRFGGELFSSSLNKGGTSKIIVNESKDNLFYFLNQYKIQQFKVYNYLDFIRVGQQFQYFDLYFMKDFLIFCCLISLIMRGIMHDSTSPRITSIVAFKLLTIS